jgi:hypothetical protein
MSWIKMNCDLETHPKVLDMSDELNVEPLHVVGMLYKVWTWAGKYSTDGKLVSDFAKIDRLVNCDGFSKSLEKNSWISKQNGKISFPKWNENNSNSAKKRALESKRSAKNRTKTINNKEVKGKKKSTVFVRLEAYENTESVRFEAYENTETTVPREEKIREEKNRRKDLSPTPSQEKAKFDPSEIELGQGLPVIEKINSLNPRWSQRPLDSVERFTIMESIKVFESIDYELLKRYFIKNPQFASKSRKAFINDCGSTACALADAWQAQAISEKIGTKSRNREPWQLQLQIEDAEKELISINQNLRNWHHVPNPKPGPGRAATVKVLKPDFDAERLRLEKLISDLRREKSETSKNAENATQKASPLS